ncbi:hypothetical protein K503DRAFT_766961 [Rhizopogon vinicolor AM-OR11-026]|uniref:Uncharacterized protein n=1 Tax=Rhizopogon vinicolor AM-OR11-026 TaxID=1314800 RepID=A0A1B7NBH4_9AGAM|nr:hypothetical protein K503DRAFT_766961 [Rhizopogon vinicolor AM-OR11-026]
MPMPPHNLQNGIQQNPSYGYVTSQSGRGSGPHSMGSHEYPTVTTAHGASHPQQQENFDWCSTQ